MKPFEFVLVVVSVIIGLSLTEFAIAVAYMISNYKTTVFYWPYSLLFATGFIAILNYWAAVYFGRNKKVWTVPDVGIFFMTGLIFFVSTKVMVPDFSKFNNNFEEFFHENIILNFYLVMCLVFFFIIESFTIRKGRKTKWYIVMGSFFILPFSGVLIENKTYREIVVVVLFLLQFYHMYASKYVIEDKENGQATRND